MEDVNQGAESSVALAVPKDAAGYAKWRADGPSSLAAKPDEGSAPQDKSAAASAAEKHAPASEAGKGKQEKPRSNAETRLNEILDDLRHAGLSPAELKTFKREARAEGQPKGEAHAAPPEKTVQPAAKLEAPKKPKQDDFKTWDEYEASRDKYVDDLAAYTRKSAVEDFQAQQRLEAEQRDLREKIGDAKKRYGDEAETTIRETAKTVFSDSSVNATVKVMLNESPHLVDLAYVLGSKPDELSAFLKMAAENPGGAIRKLVLMEQLIADELAKGGGSGGAKEGATGSAGRDPSGKFTPAGKVTSAPPPPKELGGSGTPPPDEVASAVKAGDFASFRAAANRRDIARQKGG
jgi:hypothetical protein